MKALRNRGSDPNTLTSLPDRHANQLHVLLVEDAADTVHSLALLLRCFGCRVEVVFDGGCACQAVLTGAPDVVLLDLDLPDVDGWAVAQQLHRLAWLKRPFFIGLTGYVAVGEHREPVNAGVDLVLAKPVDLDLLGRLLTKFCRIIHPPAVRMTSDGASESAIASLLPAGLLGP